MFRPYMWAIFRLRINLQIRYTRSVGVFFGGGGGVGVCERDLVSIVGINPNPQKKNTPHVMQQSDVYYQLLS